LRIGIFGGVFNPPHLGHLVCAQEAFVQLGLDVVVWVPVGEASHRAIEDDPGAEARHAMCELATAGDERFSVSRVELDRPGPSYTVDTLRELRERSPRDELVLLIGGDEAAALGAWREPEEILRLATVGAVERDGRRREEIAARLARLEGAPTGAAAGLPIRYLVPDRVAAYIGARSLYGASAPVGAA
jgi:nicotinate-nucleotide adenylyltransferase